LETVDDESRFSLTPEAIAASQAELFRASVVIDAFGGVGGNTLALARSGHHVVLIEPVRERIDAARRNLEREGLLSSVDFVHGRVESELPALLRKYPGVGLFVDPPWGGRSWERGGVDCDALLGSYGGLRPSVATVAEVVLKLPRSFDVRTLPERGGGWQLRLEWGEPLAPPKMLTAWSLSSPGGLD